MKNNVKFKKTRDGFVIIPHNAEGTSPLTQNGSGTHLVQFIVFEDGKEHKRANDVVVSFNYAKKLAADPNILYVDFDGKVVKNVCGYTR